MKLLIVADEGKQSGLADALAEDFSHERAADLPAALALVEQHAFDAVLVHLDLGESRTLDLICELKRRSRESAPGIVVLAGQADRRAIVELVRTGAYDVLLEGSMHARELAHALRNAACYARSAASLSRRRDARSQEVLVVGEGEATLSIVRLLMAAGFTARQVSRFPQSGGGVSPRAIVVDLSTVHDGEALVRLLAAD